jgi:hypothetical protein
MQKFTAAATLAAVTALLTLQAVAQTCWWRIPHITRRLVSDRVPDNAAATDMKPSLT